jgi:surface polysaccharide O-acyltransferase-like enzyme
MKLENINHRNYTLDLLKTISVFLVICIHSPFPGSYGAHVTALSRIAVPIFFMISGYYFCNGTGSEFKKRQVIKVLKLVVFSNILFFIFKASISIVKGEFLLKLTTWFSLKSFLKFILLNESPFSGHLWYLTAILYVLLIFTIVKKSNNIKLLLIITPILLSIDLILGKYSLLIWGREFPYILVRNFLFVGIPYFSIGYILNISSKNIKISNKYLIPLIVIFVFTTFIEHYCLIHFDLNPARDHYISTTLLSVSIFLFCINNRDIKIQNVWLYIGCYLSTYIYIMHPLFIYVLSKITKILNLSIYYQYIAPIIIFLITTVSVHLYLNTKKKLTSRSTGLAEARR